MKMLEKDKKFEVGYEGDYMRKVMTGMEAYRVLRLVLGIWSEQEKGNPESMIHWFAQCMERNSVCHEEFERSIKQMIEEREEDRDALHAYKFEDGSGSLKPCDCCDKCRFK